MIEPTSTTITDSHNGETDKDPDDIVDPWNVQGSSNTGIDYDKLIGKYL